MRGAQLRLASNVAVTRLALLATRCAFWGDASLTRNGTPTNAAGKWPGRRAAARAPSSLAGHPILRLGFVPTVCIQTDFNPVRRFLRTLVSTAILAAPVSV